MTDDERGWVEFYGDPICPWAHQASKWIRAVRAETGLEVRWRFFSLVEKNRRDDMPHAWEQEWTWGWSLMRVGAALRDGGESDLLDRWLGELGRRFHEEGVAVYQRSVARSVATELGIEATFEAALADEATNAAVRDDHEGVVERFRAFGVPTLVFAPGDRCLFGPKMTSAPAGEEAVRLWKLLEGFAGLDDLYQVRRPMAASDLAKMDAAFEPYYRSRSWGTLQTPVDERANAADGSGDAACAVPQQ